MTPSEQIASNGGKNAEIKDAQGRVIRLRHLTALDTLRLLKAAGPQLAQNHAWLSLAGLAYAVTEIDGIPVPTPATEAQIETLVDKLGEQALSMIGDHLDEAGDHSQAAIVASAGN